jgi:hypothetical protein
MGKDKFESKNNIDWTIHYTAIQTLHGMRTNRNDFNHRRRSDQIWFPWRCLVCCLYFWQVLYTLYEISQDTYSVTLIHTIFQWTDRVKICLLFRFTVHLLKIIWLTPWILQQFHVDKLSSAHVYLRLQIAQSWNDIPSQVLEDCAQLVKANSIEGMIFRRITLDFFLFVLPRNRHWRNDVGNKKNDITIIYTPWANLKKTAGMETGQVTFHNNKQVKCNRLSVCTFCSVAHYNFAGQASLCREEIQRDCE